MSTLDLDIHHYNLEDLETFFRLIVPYNEQDIAQREYEIRTLLLTSGHIEPHLERDFIMFLKEAKHLLIEGKIHIKNPTTIWKVDTSPVPSTFPVPNIPPPSRAENIMERKQTSFVYTQASDYFPGTLNPIDTRTVQKWMSIDSRFRPINSPTSDFIVSLPNKMTNVLSMKCSSFEMHPSTLYNVSSVLGNHSIYISIQTVDQVYHHVFILPDGHYDQQKLLHTLNRMFLSQAKTPFLFLEFKEDPYLSGNCVLMLEQNNEKSDPFIDKIKEIQLDFTVDATGHYDKKDTFSRLGTLLGFTKKKYHGSKQYMGEVPIQPYASVPYFYLAINDFNNRSVAGFETAFSKIAMSTSILARISIEFPTEKHIIFKVMNNQRKYLGPVVISRIQVQLLDAYGKVFPIGSPFSFALQFETIYDL